MPFRGNIGSTRTYSLVNQPTGNVTSIDFNGSFGAEVDDERLAGGPVGRVRIARHEAFTRLSLNWRDANAPARVRAEILCRKGGVAVRLSFDERGGAAE
jgi:hypothetical protein